MPKNTDDDTRTSRRNAVLMPVGVVALCFLFNFVGRGIGDTYMVFLLPLEAEFGWHRSQMTSVYSALMVTSGLAAPFAGMVFERFGARVLYGGGLALLCAGYFLAGHAQQLWQFYACIGVLGGLGAGAIGMVPAVALITRWVRYRASTAIGLTYAGFGCGSLVLVPLTQALIDDRGWRGAYQVLSTLLLVVLAASMLLPWRRIAAGRADAAAAVAADAPRVSSRAPLLAAVRERRFWLLVQVMFFTAVGMYLIIVQSVAYLVDVGYTPLQAAGAFGSAAMLSVLGVSTAGWLADRYGHKRAATVSFAGTFAGVAALYAMSYQAAPVLLVAYVVLFGICQGARGPVIASLSARLYAGPGQATIYGAIYACMSVGSGIGALLSGVLHDLSGGYRAAFVLAMGCLWIAAAPFWTSRSLVVPQHDARTAAVGGSAR